MQILSHRGFWTQLDERNTAPAFHRSFDLGMGTETDIRDYNGKIVIAHDPFDNKAMSLNELLKIMDGRNLTLALNVKADGLASRVQELLREYSHTNYFMFDMSTPELVKQIKQGLNVFTGVSDVSPAPVLLDHCEGIWLDCFDSDWYDSDYVDQIISINKKVCIVSADLHGRSTEAQWNMLANVKQINNENLMLCTDKPLEAKEFFGI